MNATKAANTTIENFFAFCSATEHAAKAAAKEIHRVVTLDIPILVEKAKAVGSVFAAEIAAKLDKAFKGYIAWRDETSSAIKAMAEAWGYDADYAVFAFEFAADWVLGYTIGMTIGLLLAGVLLAPFMILSDGLVVGLLTLAAVIALTALTQVVELAVFVLGFWAFSVAILEGERLYKRLVALQGAYRAYQRAQAVCC